jgi:hypothetical protein
LVKVSLESTNGQQRSPGKVNKILLAYQQVDLRAQKKCFTQWMEHSFKMIQKFILCIKRLMEIMHQENKKKETIIGKLTQLLTALVMPKRKSLMEQPMPSMPRDLKKITPKLPLSRRLLRTTTLSQMICLEKVKI